MAPGPTRRAAVTDTATEAPERECLEPSQSRGAHWHSGNLPAPPTPSTTTPDPPPVPWCPATPSKTSPPGGATSEDPTSHPEGAAETRAATVHCGATGKRTTEQTERGRPPPQPQQPPAWPRRAPQDRAPSGSAGKRRAPASWIRSQSSLEETKRRGARVRSGATRPPPPSSPPLGAGPMKTPWCTSSGASCPLLVLNPGGETPWAWPRRRVPRAQSRRSGDAETKAHCPGSSTCDALTRDQEKPSPVHPQNAGAPSSKPSAEDKAAEPAGREEGEEQAADSQPLEMLTH